MIAELRELLAQGQSGDTFKYIFDLLSAGRLHDDYSLAVEYAKDHMQSWEPASRCWEFSEMKELSIDGVVPQHFSLVGSLKVLFGTGIASDVLRKLTQSPHMGGLRELIVRSGGGLDTCAVMALVNAPHMLYLQTLDLWGTPLTDRSVIAIANSPYMMHLEVLDLRYCLISQAAVDAVLKSQYLQWKVKSFMHLHSDACTSDFDGRSYR